MRLFCISPHFQQSIMGGAERWEYDYKLQCGGGNKLWWSFFINTQFSSKCGVLELSTKSFLFKTWIGTTKHLTNLDIRNIKNINLEHFQHFIFSRGLRRWSKKIASKYHQKLKLFEIRKIQRTKSLNGKFRAWGWKWWDISYNPHKKNLQIKLPNQIFTTKGASEHQTKCNCCL